LTKSMPPHPQTIQRNRFAQIIDPSFLESRQAVFWFSATLSSGVLELAS
jgi:hypothetical protein